jgi:hypothetical protein
MPVPATTEMRMKTRIVLVAGLLTACQAWQAHAPEHPPPHRGAGTGAGASGSAGTGTASGSGASYGGEPADIASRRDMCELAQRIRNAPSPQARQALMEQAMPDMSQASRERHVQMMGQGCE